MRVGMGHDIHQLVEGRKLIIGGVEIPFEKGLLGHSDADVLIHAICDALLGAAKLGDIGLHFPDNQDKYKDVCSLDLLSTVKELVAKKGYVVVNLDATVFAQAPKLSPYRLQMEAQISKALEIDEDRINIKFTTAEELGFVGAGRGIQASCITLIEKRTNHENI